MSYVWREEERSFREGEGRETRLEDGWSRANSVPEMK
jgi:hypothetical protein